MRWSEYTCHWTVHLKMANTVYFVLSQFKKIKNFKIRQLPSQSCYLSLLFSRQTFTILDLMSKLITKTTWLGFVWFEFFSNNGKVGFMCSKAEHDEISYRSIMTKIQHSEHFEIILTISKDTGHYHNTRQQHKEKSKGVHRDGKAKMPNTS